MHYFFHNALGALPRVEIMSKKKLNPFTSKVYLPILRDFMAIEFNREFETVYADNIGHSTRPIKGRYTKAMKEYAAIFGAGYVAGARVR